MHTHTYPQWRDIYIISAEQPDKKEIGHWMFIHIFSQYSTPFFSPSLMSLCLAFFLTPTAVEGFCPTKWDDFFRLHSCPRQTCSSIGGKNVSHRNPSPFERYSSLGLVQVCRCDCCTCSSALRSLVKLSSRPLFEYHWPLILYRLIEHSASLGGTSTDWCNCR